MNLHEATENRCDLAGKDLAVKIGKGAKTRWDIRQDGQSGENLAALSDPCRAVWRCLTELVAQSTNKSPTVSNTLSIGVGNLFVDCAITTPRLVELTKLPIHTVRRCLHDLAELFYILPVGKGNNKRWTLAAKAFPETVSDMQSDEAFFESHPEFVGESAVGETPNASFAQRDFLFKTEALKERLLMEEEKAAQVARAIQTATADVRPASDSVVESNVSA